MAPVDPLLELRVDVHRHLRVGVADLAHHPLDVEVVGEQRDRDVGAAQGVGRRVWQRRHAALAQALARQLGGLSDDLADALAIEPAAVQVRHQVVLGAGRGTHAAQPLEVLDHRLDQVGAHLHLADATLGLRVGDAEARSLGVVDAEVADLQVAQLAGADAAAAEYLADDAAADVAAADLGAEAAQVEADRRLGDAEALGDLVGPQAFGDQVGDQRRGRPEVDRGAAGRKRHLLRCGGVEQGGQLVHLQEAAPRLGNVDAHPLSAGGVVVDVAVLDRVVEDRGESAEYLADRRRPERHGASAAVVTDVGARGERLAQLLRLAQQMGLELEAQVAVDPVEWQLAEEGQQVAAQPPAVVAGRALGDRLGAEHAVDLGVEPPPGVVAEEGSVVGHLGEPGRRLGPLPEAEPHAGEDVAQLGASRGLVPAPAAAAGAVGPLVQDQSFALAADAEAEMEGARAVAERPRLDRAACLPGHRVYLPVLGRGRCCRAARPLLQSSSILALLPVVGR